MYTSALAHFASASTTTRLDYAQREEAGGGADAASQSSRSGLGHNRSRESSCSPIVVQMFRRWVDYNDATTFPNATWNTFSPISFGSTNPQKDFAVVDEMAMSSKLMMNPPPAHSTPMSSVVLKALSEWEDRLIPLADVFLCDRDGVLIPFECFEHDAELASLFSDQHYHHTHGRSSSATTDVSFRCLKPTTTLRDCRRLFENSSGVIPQCKKNDASASSQPYYKIPSASNSPLVCLLLLPRPSITTDPDKVIHALQVLYDYAYAATGREEAARRVEERNKIAEKAAARQCNVRRKEEQQEQRAKERISIAYGFIA